MSVILLMLATAAAVPVWGGYHTEAWCESSDDWCDSNFGGIDWEGSAIVDDSHIASIESAESVEVMGWGAVAGVDELLWLDTCAPSASNCADKRLVVIWNDADDADLSSSLSFDDTGYRPSDGSSAISSPPAFGGYTALVTYEPASSVSTTPNTWAQQTVNTWMYLRDFIVEKHPGGNLTSATLGSVTDSFDASSLVLDEALHEYLVFKDSEEHVNYRYNTVQDDGQIGFWAYAWESMGTTDAIVPENNCGGKTAGTEVDCSGSALRTCEALVQGFGCEAKMDADGDQQCECLGSGSAGGLTAACSFVGSCPTGSQHGAALMYGSEW